LSLNLIFSFQKKSEFILQNDFNELTIKYGSGDEVYNVEEMTFSKKGNVVFASITQPNKNSLENSKTKLTKDDLLIIDKFLSKIYRFKDGCNEIENNSYVKHYDVNVDGNEYEILKFCDWDDSNFFALKNQIFSEYLIRLEKSQIALNKINNELLLGFWKYDFTIHKVIKDKIYTLNRIKNKSQEKCYLKFKPNQKLTDYYCLENSKTNYNFRFDVLDEDLFLYINGENGNDNKKFIYGYVFKVLQLNEDEIKLTTQ
jgi:hypothetical protein